MTEELDTKADKTDRQETGGVKRPLLKRIPGVGPALSLYQSYSRRNGPLLSAGIAYYGLFALAPLMFLTIQVSGYIVGASTAQTELREALETYLGPKLADVLSGILVSSSVPSRGSTTTTFIGAVLLLYAATRLFLRLKASFNVMWDIRTSWEKSSPKRFLSRLATLGMILIPTLLLLVSLFFSAGISWLESLFGTSGWLLSVAEALLPFLVGWWALIAIFTVLPDLRISWRDSWLGALCAAVLWSVGARVFGAYLSWSTSQKYAGAVGALIAFIVWVNFMAIIALLGARLSRLLYKWRGKVLHPYSFAEIVPQESKDRNAEAYASSAVAPAAAPQTSADSKSLEGGDEGAGEPTLPAEGEPSAGTSDKRSEDSL